MAGSRRRSWEPSGSLAEHRAHLARLAGDHNRDVTGRYRESADAWRAEGDVFAMLRLARDVGIDPRLRVEAVSRMIRVVVDARLTDIDRSLRLVRLAEVWARDEGGIDELRKRGAALGQLEGRERLPRFLQAAISLVWAVSDGRGDECLVDAAFALASEHHGSDDFPLAATRWMADILRSAIAPSEVGASAVFAEGRAEARRRR